MNHGLGVNMKFLIVPILFLALSCESKEKEPEQPSTSQPEAEDPVVPLPFPEPPPKNEITSVNHTGGPVLYAVKCFHHPEEPFHEFVIAPNESRDFPLTCPERAQEFFEWVESREWEK